MKNIILIIIVFYLIGCSLNQSTQKIDISDQYYKAQVVIINKETYEKKLETFETPYSPPTLIAFEIENESKVQIELFDMKENLISTIFDGELKPESYRVIMTETNLDSGLYFFRIHINDKVKMEKFILLY